MGSEILHIQRTYRLHAGKIRTMTPTLFDHTRQIENYTCPLQQDCLVHRSSWSILASERPMVLHETRRSCLFARKLALFHGIVNSCMIQSPPPSHTHTHCHANYHHYHIIFHTILSTSSLRLAMPCTSLVRDERQDLGGNLIERVYIKIVYLTTRNVTWQANGRTT